MLNPEKDCADCGEPMAIRENKEDGSKFWGCTAYPECTHTEPFEEDEEDGWDKNDVDYR